MQYYPFDSRNSLYKSVYGAVASDTPLRLRVLLHKDAKVHNVWLCIKNDNCNNFTEYSLTPCDWLEDYRFYDFTLPFEEGLYWYYFRYTSDFGQFKITKSEHSLGIISDSGDLWQLTVYDKEYKTPDWLKGGIIYQIFPDRFYNSGQSKNNVPSDRYIENDWSALPEHRQTNSIKTLGNDYFGGDLKGITKKLDYLASLGVSALYLNPIFEAHSNHRYNTADYMKIDSLLGSEDDLAELCSKAKEYGISVILDGVFSHTGDDSIYFNKYNRYDNLGAYNSQDSNYYSWYSFKNFPDSYNSWWGITTLPETNENDSSFTDFITGENGVLRYWLKKGVMGWRLDVADELPDAFLDNVRKAIKTENSEAFLLGEVWEDATNKISSGGRRRFLRGNQLDSVMNYPFAEAIISFLKGENSRKLIDAVLDITENYPPQSVDLLMNHIGTHDTQRILTRLGADDGYCGDRNWQSVQKLNDEQIIHAVRFLKLAVALQYTLPGVPSVYYGDEAGLEGYGDPFCRKTYPWGKENQELIDFYKTMGEIRRSNPCFAGGKFIPVYANMGHIAYIRESQDKACSLLIAVNRWCDDAYIELPDGFENATILYGNTEIDKTLKIPKENFIILKKSEN
ncbi:MAG: glycoside hydrolase family 13 protein [Acutalibacteraceae bacterium]|nr:glycoside hydrolase family 13 protein [Acutalibacteraceae bacterium]